MISTGSRKEKIMLKVEAIHEDGSVGEVVVCVRNIPHTAFDNLDAPGGGELVAIVEGKGSQVMRPIRWNSGYMAWTACGQSGMYLEVPSAKPTAEEIIEWHNANVHSCTTGNTATLRLAHTGDYRGRM